MKSSHVKSATTKELLRHAYYEAEEGKSPQNVYSELDSRIPGWRGVFDTVCDCTSDLPDPATYVATETLRRLGQ